MTTDTRNRLTHILRAVTWRVGRRVRQAEFLSVVRQWAQWEGIGVSDAQVKAQFTRAPSRRSRRHCLDCGIDTVAIGEYPYYLRDALWRRVVPSGRGMLCLDCLEVRLGRPLRQKDFHEGRGPMVHRASR
jgi:hypothetical protein